jgi:hypothetical protein
MVDLKKYHDRLQNKIREAMSADKILEGPWWEVVIKDLNLMSYYCARDIALETKGSCDKNYLDGTLAYKLPYEEWPPMRLMALTLIVSYWLGWISTSHGLKDGSSLIQGAYTAGLTEYLNSINAHNPGTTMSNPSKTAEPITPKDGQNGTHDTNAKTEETS